ncbi:MAG: proline racemase family protein, partial [Chloroflexota bacterium]|nr:proline racemase family protein [Chloroflexota bacterium]
MSLSWITDDVVAKRKTAVATAVASSSLWSAGVATAILHRGGAIAQTEALHGVARQPPAVHWAARQPPAVRWAAHQHRATKGRSVHIQRVFSTIDAHAGGQPLRIITSGIPPLKGETVRERRDWLQEHHDDIRRVLLHEPRG